MKKIKNFFRTVGAKTDYAFFEMRSNYDIIDYLAWIFAILFVITFIAWIIVIILGI